MNFKKPGFVTGGCFITARKPFDTVTFSGGDDRNRTDASGSSVQRAQQKQNLTTLHLRFWWDRQDSNLHCFFVPILRTGELNHLLNCPEWRG